MCFINNYLEFVINITLSVYIFEYSLLFHYYRRIMLLCDLFTIPFKCKVSKITHFRII